MHKKLWLLLALLFFVTGWFGYKYDLAKIKTETVEPATLNVANFTHVEIDIPVHKVYDVSGGGFTVTAIENVKVTAYNNEPGQTNDQPNIGASNRKVYEGSVAVSRDLLKIYNITYGDVVCLLKTSKCYIVEDTMNKRYDDTIKKGSGRRVDIFMYSKKEALKVSYTTDIIHLKQR